MTIDHHTLRQACEMGLILDEHARAYEGIGVILDAIHAQDKAQDALLEHAGLERSPISVRKVMAFPMYEAAVHLCMLNVNEYIISDCIWLCSHRSYNSPRSMDYYLAYLDEQVSWGVERVHKWASMAYCSALDRQQHDAERWPKLRAVWYPIPADEWVLSSQIG